MQDNLESRTALAEGIHKIVDTIEEDKEYEVEVQTEAFTQYLLFLLNQYDPEVNYSYFIRNDKFIIYKKIAQNGLFSALFIVLMTVFVMSSILFLTRNDTLTKF